jgi:hypothetical protein
VIDTATHHTATIGRMALVNSLISKTSLNYISRFNTYGAVSTVLDYHPLNAVKKPVAMRFENHTKHINVVCWQK